MNPIVFSSEVYQFPGKGGWTYVVWPDSVDAFGTRGTVKVRGTFDDRAFRSSFMAKGDGTHMLPVTAAMLAALDKRVGDTVKVTITERL